MQSLNIPLLNITGKASTKVFEILNIETNLPSNQIWLFFDYANTNTFINREYSLSFSEKPLSDVIFHMRILKCLDSSGNSYPEIPEGHKSLCKVAFSPFIPQEINNLKLLDGWAYNPDSVKLKLKEITDTKINDSALNDIYTLAYISLKNNILPTSDIISIREFYEYLEKFLQVDHNRAEFIYLFFVKQGKIKPMNNDKIELLPAV
ncbi:MAG: hypothetical protein ACTHMC_09630 [Pseudobacter sp.]|uniref:hypothetical protein n=1 Tax=Pseudobacter sp. TaxID=2045420 RepID=UPI003F7F4A4B